MEQTVRTKQFHLLQQRRAGILLHPTSLPGPLPSGDMGHDAYRFVEFLATSGIGLWQMLPLGPTHDDGSPYQCLSVHAGNPRLISLDWLRDRGWLDETKVSVAATHQDYRQACLHTAWEGFNRHADESHRQGFEEFRRQHASWLDDYALYCAIRREQKNRIWTKWPAELRDRQAAALESVRRKLHESLEQVRFEQYVFFSQWYELKQYAHRHDVWLFGDCPIFVALDSADVWCHREYFELDESGRATVVAGVPPDYFSATGQRWGNPLYNWEAMQADGFKWWIERIQSQLELFDVVRVDHFRGFEAYWEIPAEAKTAVEGHWVKAPGEVLLHTLHEHFDGLPLVAEDLGVITPEVEALRRRFDLPGMKVLQFAFSGGADNPYLPHNHEVNSVVYTGTHDNDTTLAWYQKLPAEQQRLIEDYLGYPVGGSMPWPLIRTALASVACLAVLPMQDVLGLGEGERMNTPGTRSGNWQWRFDWPQIPADLSGRLRHLLHLYGRDSGYSGGG